MSNCNSTTCGSIQKDVHNLRVFLINKDKDLGEKLTTFLQAGGICSIDTASQIKDLSLSLNNSNSDIVFINPDGFKKSVSDLIEEVNLSELDTSIVLIDDIANNETSLLPFGSVSYIEKPLSFISIEKIIDSILFEKKMNRFETILGRMNSAICPVKLKFSTRQGHIFIDPEEILYFKADSNYTHIFLRDRKQVTVAKSLRNFDIGLSNSFFARISRSAIVNLNYLMEYDRHNKMCLLRYEEQEYKLPVTKSHIKSLLSNYLNC